MPSGGGSIELSEGTFNISASISINKNKVFIKGQGRSTDIANTNTSFIYVEGNDVFMLNCRVRFIYPVASGVRAICCVFTQVINEVDFNMVGCDAGTVDNTNGNKLILTGNKIGTLNTNANILPSTTAALKDVNDITTVNFV